MEMLRTENRSLKVLIEAIQTENDGLKRAVAREKNERERDVQGLQSQINELFEKVKK